VAKNPQAPQSIAGGLAALPRLRTIDLPTPSNLIAIILASDGQPRNDGNTNILG